ncbi:MAG: hypothetical protein ACE3JK_14530 [Sporolactobacillus sp.]
MARLKKLNRVIDVSDGFVNSYLIRGYDEIDDKGTIIKRATGGRNVSLPEYNKLLDENEQLKAELKGVKSPAKK